MNAMRYASKVVYYGGYPGSSGKPVAGRLSWRDGALTFEPNGPAKRVFRFERSRLLGIRRSEEGLTGGRRVRLLIDVATETGATATLKFEMGGFFWKERKFARWLELLELVCQGENAGKTPASPEDERV